MSSVVSSIRLKTRLNNICLKCIHLRKVNYTTGNTRLKSTTNGGQCLLFCNSPSNRCEAYCTHKVITEQQSKSEENMMTGLLLLHEKNAFDARLLVQPYHCYKCHRYNLQLSTSAVNYVTNIANIANGKKIIHLRLPVFGSTSYGNVGGAGQWYMDPHSTSYKQSTCSIIDSRQACLEKEGYNQNRSKYRWSLDSTSTISVPQGVPQPYEFPYYSFNQCVSGHQFLFMGDSLMRNQYQSLDCLLKSRSLSIPYAYSAEPFGVHWVQNKANGAITLDMSRCVWAEIAQKYASIGEKLIIYTNFGHWFGHHNLYLLSGNVHLNDPITQSKAMRNAAMKCIKELKRVVPKATIVFSSYSPCHWRGGTWDHGGHCGVNKPPAANKGNFRKDSVQIMFDYEVYRGLEEVKYFDEPNRHKYLNISAISRSRPDAHPANSGDCCHWCLPGVPDWWNVLVFMLLKC